VTLALIVIDIVQVWASVHGYGAFANLDLGHYQRLLTLQVFVTNLGILMLILAAALEEQTDLRFRAETATRIRDDFISVASHELKTPLQSLKMEIQILNNYITKGQIRTIPEEKLKRLARISDQEITRFAGLINDLLDISRISSGNIPLNLENVDILDLVHGAVERQRAELEKSGSIVTVTGQKNIHGNWDHSRIEQVLTNLISNAIKYGNGLPILVDVKEEGGYAVVSVIDHGLGIKKEDQRRIFERFERAVPNSEYSGMGLGLFIASQIIEAHHGQIKVESMNGNGTIFKVQLPLAVKVGEIHPYWKAKENYQGQIYH
jgi:signal transduction histidine kinase